MNGHHLTRFMVYNMLKGRSLRRDRIKITIIFNKKERERVCAEGERHKINYDTSHEQVLWRLS